MKTIWRNYKVIIAKAKQYHKLDNLVEEYETQKELWFNITKLVSQIKENLEYIMKQEEIEKHLNWQ